MRCRALLVATIVIGCRSTTAPCPVGQGAGCRWRREFDDAKGVVQITTEIWYRTCPVEKPDQSYRVIPDSAATCDLSSTADIVKVAR